MEPYISGSEEEVRRREVYMYYGLLARVDWSRSLQSQAVFLLFFLPEPKLSLGFSFFKILTFQDPRVIGKKRYASHFLPRILNCQAPNHQVLACLGDELGVKFPTNHPRSVDHHVFHWVALLLRCCFLGSGDSNRWPPRHTVDERNPTSLGMPQTILIVGPNQHLGHPKWCRIFSMNSMIPKNARKKKCYQHFIL